MRHVARPRPRPSAPRGGGCERCGRARARPRGTKRAHGAPGRAGQTASGSLGTGPARRTPLRGSAARPRGCSDCAAPRSGEEAPISPLVRAGTRGNGRSSGGRVGLGIRRNSSSRTRSSEQSALGSHSSSLTQLQEHRENTLSHRMGLLGCPVRARSWT